MSEAADWLRFAGEDLKWPADAEEALVRQLLAAVGASIGG